MRPYPATAERRYVVILWPRLLLAALLYPLLQLGTLQRRIWLSVMRPLRRRPLDRVPYLPQHIWDLPERRGEVLNHVESQSRQLDMVQLFRVVAPAEV